MERVKEKTIKYLGVENPNTIEEIEVELLGLDTAVKKAEMRASELRQGLSVAKLRFLEKAKAEKQEEKKEEAKEE